MSPIIEAPGVSKSYGGVKANSDISVTVAEGGITGLIGPIQNLALPCSSLSITCTSS